MSELTIVIPCIDSRLNLLCPTVKNLKRNFPDVKILCGIGVSAENADRQLIVVPDATVLIQDKSQPFWQRFYELSKHVTTDYVLTCADDDHIVAFDYRKLIIALQKSKAAVYMLQACRVKEDNGKLSFSPYPRSPFMSDDPLKRLNLLYKAYNHHDWGFLSTANILTKKLEQTVKLSSDVMYSQYLDSSTAVLHNKVITGAFIGYIKRIDGNNGGVIMAQNRDMKHFPWMLFAKDFSEKLNQFAECIFAVLDNLNIAYEQKDIYRLMLSLHRWALFVEREQFQKNFLESYLEILKKFRAQHHNKYESIDEFYAVN